MVHKELDVGVARRVQIVINRTLGRNPDLCWLHFESEEDKC